MDSFDIDEINRQAMNCDSESNQGFSDESENYYEVKPNYQKRENLDLAPVRETEPEPDKPQK